MSSNRLPGKVLMEVGGGKLIDRIINSALLSSKVNKIYVATSNDKSDDPLVEYLKNEEVSIFRGSLDNVFSRYYEIALIEKNNFDSVVRLTADCPLLDSNLIDNVIEYHDKNNYEYTTTGLSKSFPLGQAVEVINLKTLLELNTNSLDKEDLEHVTRYIWKRPQTFNCGSFTYVNKKYPGFWDTYTLFRLYINCFAPREQAYFHTDSGVWTFLYYPIHNFDCDKNQGGCTEFFVDEQIIGIPPYYNSMVRFSAPMEHRATPFKDHHRFTIALKCIKK